MVRSSKIEMRNSKQIRIRNSLNLNFATEGEDRQPTRRERALLKDAEGFFALN